VNFGGAPGFGASAKRLATRRSFERHLGTFQPTPAPFAWRLVIDAQLARDLQVVPAVAS